MKITMMTPIVIKSTDVKFYSNSNFSFYKCIVIDKYKEKLSVNLTRKINQLINI